MVLTVVGQVQKLETPRMRLAAIRAESGELGFSQLFSILLEEGYPPEEALFSLGEYLVFP